MGLHSFVLGYQQSLPWVSTVICDPFDGFLWSLPQLSTVPSVGLYSYQWSLLQLSIVLTIVIHRSVVPSAVICSYPWLSAVICGHQQSLPQLSLVPSVVIHRFPFHGYLCLSAVIHGPFCSPSCGCPQVSTTPSAVICGSPWLSAVPSAGLCSPFCGSLWSLPQLSTVPSTIIHSPFHGYLHVSMGLFSTTVTSMGLAGF